jgi:putative nucleotidyltransferase with HDIG domain
MGGSFFLDSSNFSINKNLYQILAFVVISYLVNWLLISIINSMFSSKNIFYVLAENIKLMTLNSMAMLPFAIILAIVFRQYNYLGVLLFIFPIILVRYTFSLYIQSKSQYVDTVDALMRAMEARDNYTEGHSQRVAELVNEIAKEMRYNEWQIEKLNMASLLHDVGKIGIDDHILNKPGKLTEEEFNIIKSHPEIGYGILKDIKNMKDIIDIVRHHHERYDGKGYPEGKKADELSFDVFIVQLADSVDAMATDRPYRKALTQEEGRFSRFWVAESRYSNNRKGYNCQKYKYKEKKSSGNPFFLSCFLRSWTKTSCIIVF